MTKHDILNTLSTVDLYSQLACLGSMQYVCASECINRAIKLMPSTSEGLDAFLNEERNLKLDIEYAGNTLGDGSARGEMEGLTSAHDVETTPGNYYEQRRELMALLDLRQTFLDLSEELVEGLEQRAVHERSLLNTMQFMLSNIKADPLRYKRQYVNNKRLGLKNYGQTMAQYVDQETKRALELREQFIAKGEIAVQYLEGLDTREGPISERIMESLAARCVAKLIARRIKIGQSLSWRTDVEQRADAEADILFIEKAIEALGGEVPPEAVVPDEVEEEIVQPALQQQQQHANVDLDAFIAILQEQRDAQALKHPGKPYAETARQPGECITTH
jgi:hypothetical protein